jgi:ectoine hydroxylase-related dioxygenase (phytanoyl-CoA dioxygenase family)
MVGSHRESAKNYDKLERACSPTVNLGSALVFNGKLNHRGTANHSSEDRPVIYRVYHKRWYNDFFRVGIDDVEE